MEEHPAGKDPWEIIENMTSGCVSRPAGIKPSEERPANPKPPHLPCPRCHVEVLTPVSVGADPYTIFHRCGSIFAAPLPRNRIPVTPPGVRLDETGERTRITMPWFRPIA